MYFYKFGYESPEESHFVMLSHTLPHDQESFNLMCKRAYEAAVKANDSDVEIKDVYTYAANYLCREYGFSRVEPTAKFMPFGWAKMDGTRNVTGFEDEYEKELNQFNVVLENIT